jgi:RND family efflux transporter MFP subunit
MRSEDGSAGTATAEVTDMRVRLLRREFGGFWRGMSRLAAPLVVIEVILLLLVSRHADAAVQVAWVQAEPAERYETLRVYAGRTVPGRVSELGFKQPGQLATVLVDDGDRVGAGQVLARLDADGLQAALRQAQAEVAVAAASLRSAEAHAELARQTEARFASLRDSGHVSEQEYDERALTLRARLAELAVAEAGLARARAARAVAEIAVDEAVLRAPFGGIVQARHRDEGAQVQPAEPVLRLVETTRVEAHVGVPDTLTAGLEPGARYPVRWNGRTLTATLASLLPEVDADTRTRTAVLELARADPPETGPPLGAVVELLLQRTVEAAGFWLPLTALTEADRGLWSVYVINGDTTVERRLVEILHAEAERAYVRGTLEPGDRVVSSGAQRVVPGQRVEPAQPG